MASATAVRNFNLLNSSMWIGGRCCVTVCPVDAIFTEDDVPEDEKDFIAVNRFVFAETSQAA